MHACMRACGVGRCQQQQQQQLLPANGRGVAGLGRNRVRRLEWWAVAGLSLGAYTVRAEEADQDSRLQRLQRALHAHALHYCITALLNHCSALCMRTRCIFFCAALLHY